MHKRGGIVSNSLSKKKGQITIFIIIAVVIIAGVAAYFIFRNQIGKIGIPADMQPVYTTFLSCLEERTLTGVSVLESQGGYIELPEFEQGSGYSPFSSQLNFLGNPIPYWYYVSENNFEKEQVPTKTEMGNQLENFINEKIRNCVFDSYYEQGFEIIQGEPRANVLIRNSDIVVNLNMNLNIKKANQSASLTNHKINVKTNLGSLYDSAIKVYDYEQSNLFLEEYAIDNLRLYAPVDGVELTCSPKFWIASSVFSQLREAIETNTLALTTQGDKNNYFNVKIPVSDNVRFLNSRDWTYNYEVNPSDGNVLIANPVGTQQGLGILGFCYVTYHFVYNIKYPVLVQVQRGEEIFQFPMAIVIQGNKPRKALDASAYATSSPEICKYRNTQLEVRTLNDEGNSVNSDISYECFGETCHIGKTSFGVLSSNFPQCVNGFVVARADGFEDAKYMFTTTQSGSVDIIMNKLYSKSVDLNIGGKDYNGRAVITFTLGEISKTILYPEQKEIKLSEGDYEIKVSAYDEASLKLQAGTYKQCIDVPSALGGLFGVKEKKCFDVQVPSQILSNVLAGGGTQSYYITKNELITSNLIEINADSLPEPKSVEDLQNNYNLFDTKTLEIIFK
ncbi:MAG: hypothetical protein Q7S06_00265 [Nanoarchaeota archaeon]|nr:hypothetical protein [Nanoarchaeota archaeon]